MATMRLLDFEDAMDRGHVGSFAATDIETSKQFFAAALRSKIAGFNSQQEVSVAWSVSEPTISYIVRDKLDRVSAGFMLSLLIKSGARIEIKVA